MNTYQWNQIAPLFDIHRKRKHDVRDIVTAILYALDHGIQWRSLPERFPPWQTVFYYYRRWQVDGTWKKVLDTLESMEVPA